MISNYKQFLKTKLEEKQSYNPAYSLRAFARDLGISPSRLSEILNEKQGLSEKMAQKISVKLKLNEKESEMFCSSVVAMDSRSKIKRKVAESKLKSMRIEDIYPLSYDTFKVISDWYHFAIWELTVIDGFKSDVKWIARKLDISENLAAQAVERLLRLDLIRKENGKYVPTANKVLVDETQPKSKGSDFHEQLLEKAKTYLSSEESNARYFGNYIIAVNSEQVSKYKAALKNYMMQLLNDIEHTSGKKDHLYVLGAQFFKLTKE